MFSLTVFLGLTSVPASAAGETGWYCQRLGSGNYSCVSAVDSSTAWVGTSDGNIFKTADGGATWNQQFALGADSAIRDIVAVDRDTAWAVGYSAQVSGVVKTDDGGRNWNLQWYINARDVLTSVCAVDGKTAWVAGAGIIKTEDGGASWKMQHDQPAPEVFYSITAANARTVWAVTTEVLFKSTDGGSTWSELHYPEFPISSTLPYYLSAADTENVWAVGSWGWIMHTSNGSDWEMQSGNEFPFLYGVSAVDGQAAWAVGSDSAILKTTDGGVTWSRQYCWPPDSLRDVSAIDANTVWAVGDKGIYHTTDGGAGNGPRPYIQSVTPEQGRAGSWLVIEGQHFGDEHGDSYVSIGTVRPPAYDNWSDTHIACQVPQVDPTPQPVQVTVTTQYGTSNAMTFTIMPPPAPVTVTGIWPPMGFAGATFDAVIFGTGFQQGARVEFGGGMNSGWGPVGISNVAVVSDAIITCRLILPTPNPFFFPPQFGTSFTVSVANPDGGYSTGTVMFGVIGNLCGAGAGGSVGIVGVLMGAMSLAGTLGARRRRRRRKAGK